MSDFLRTGGKLALICAVAAATLALVNAVTEPRIEMLRRARQAEILGPHVLGDAYMGDEEKVAADNVRTLFRVYANADDSKIGYVLELRGNGYAGPMTVLAYYDRAAVIQFAKLMENEETPGIGKIFEDESKLEFMIGAGGDRAIPTRKGDLSGAAADIVSGATVTFQGIAAILKAGSEYVGQLEG